MPTGAVLLHPLWRNLLHSLLENEGMASKNSSWWKGLEKGQPPTGVCREEQDFAGIGVLPPVLWNVSLIDNWSIAYPEAWADYEKGISVTLTELDEGTLRWFYSELFNCQHLGRRPGPCMEPMRVGISTKGPEGRNWRQPKTLIQHYFPAF